MRYRGNRRRRRIKEEVCMTIDVIAVGGKSDLQRVRMEQPKQKLKIESH